MLKYGLRLVTGVLLLSAMQGMVSHSACWAAGMKAIDRGTWVWDTRQLLAASTETQRLADNLIAGGATEAYLYLRAPDYVTYGPRLRQLIARLSQRGIKVFGLEGYRGFFADAYGPGDLYAAVEQLLAYNRSVDVNQRFAGFHLDMEPQDGQGVGEDLFHNGIRQSQLTPQQLRDRDRLLADWIDIHDNVSQVLHDQGLRLGTAVASWMDEYYGEPILAVRRGERRPVIQFLYPLVDEFVLMAYNTNPSNVISRVLGELKYANTLPNPPKIVAAIETHTGVGINISYGDTPGKAAKDIVVRDLDQIYLMLMDYKAFAGLNIHDWKGWRALPLRLAGTTMRTTSRAKGTQMTGLCGWVPR